jgi:hypothetical protein
MLASHTGPTSEGSGRGLPNVEPPSSERATPRQLHVTLLVLYPRWYASFRMLTSTPPLGVSAKHGSTCSCSMAGFRGSLAFLASLNVAPPSSEYQTTEKVCTPWLAAKSILCGWNLLPAESWIPAPGPTPTMGTPTKSGPRSWRDVGRCRECLPQVGGLDL